MSYSLPPIYFYIPSDQWPSSFPEDVEGYWQWQNATEGTYRSGKYNWTLQTYLQLKSFGSPCLLTASMPAEGIVISHRNFLPFGLKPGPKLLLVCIQADRPRHPYAQIHIVQNPEDAGRSFSILRDPFKQFSEKYYIPYWPQPEIKARDPKRGDRFENVGYFGLTYNLAAELREAVWQDQLKSLGLSWYIPSREKWDDYREVDVIVSVRSFSYQGAFLKKPPSKLVNAWHAGVPAILGYESAFRAQRKSNLDYIEVRSPDEVITALKRLKEDQALRQAMVENGYKRAQETNPSQIGKRWKSFLTDAASPYYAAWSTAPSWKHQQFLLSRSIRIKVDKLKNRLSSTSEWEKSYWD